MPNWVHIKVVVYQLLNILIIEIIDQVIYVNIIKFISKMEI